MTKFLITKQDGSTRTIEADRLERDGSGTRLYKTTTTKETDPEDARKKIEVQHEAMVASYQDGQVLSVEPE